MKTTILFLISLILLTNSFVNSSNLSQFKPKTRNIPQRNLNGILRKTEENEDKNYIVVYYKEGTKYEFYRRKEKIAKLVVDDSSDPITTLGTFDNPITVKSFIKIYLSKPIEKLDGFFSFSSDSTTCDENANQIISIDFSKIDSTTVSSMKELFKGCVNLKSVNFTDFDSSKVTDMSSMFEECTSLASLDLSNLATTKLGVVSSMFSGCSNLIFLNIAKFDFSNIIIPEEGSDDSKDKNYANMFKDVSLKYINLEQVNDPKGIIKPALALTDDQELTVCQTKDNKILEGGKINETCCDFNVTEGKCSEPPANDANSTNSTNTTSSNQLSTTINTEAATNIATTQNANLPSDTATAKPTETVTTTIPNEPSGSLPKFIIESINQNNCDTTGKLIFQGKLTQSFSRTVKLTLPFKIHQA